MGSDGRRRPCWQGGKAITQTMHFFDKCGYVRLSKYMTMISTMVSCMRDQAQWTHSGTRHRSTRESMSEALSDDMCREEALLLSSVGSASMDRGAFSTAARLRTLTGWPCAIWDLRIYMSVYVYALCMYTCTRASTVHIRTSVCRYVRCHPAGISRPVI